MTIRPPFGSGRADRPLRRQRPARPDLSPRSEPGKEEFARASPRPAYQHGARSSSTSPSSTCTSSALALCTPTPRRSTSSRRGTASGVLALGDQRCARIGPVGAVAAQRSMDDVDPELRRPRPAARTSARRSQVVNERTTNWTAVRARPPAGRSSCTPSSSPRPRSSGCGTRSSTSAGSTRTTRSPPWTAAPGQAAGGGRPARRARTSTRCASRGPGTDLTIGLLPTSSAGWRADDDVDGIVHCAEPPHRGGVHDARSQARRGRRALDQAAVRRRGDDHAGCEVRFEGGRAVEIDADEGASVLRTLTERDDGAVRLGEVALVDREGRIGRSTPSSTTRCSTRTPPATSRSATASSSRSTTSGPRRDQRQRVHIDFMIGTDDVAVDRDDRGRRRGPAAARRRLADLSAVR